MMRAVVVFAGAAHARQHEGMGNATGCECTPEDTHHGVLADEIVEPARPVGAGQHPVGCGGRDRGRRRCNRGIDRTGRALRRAVQAAGLRAGDRFRSRDLLDDRTPAKASAEAMQSRAAFSTITILGEAGGPDTDPNGTRCGCFLPDLTGLARRSSVADPPGAVLYASRGALASMIATCPACLCHATNACAPDIALFPEFLPVARMSIPAIPSTGVAERRADADFIAAAFASPQALVVPIWQAQSLFHAEGARFFTPSDSAGWGRHRGASDFSGLVAGAAPFSPSTSITMPTRCPCCRRA